jgi:hypothetical protein
MKGTKGIQMGSERHRDHQGQDEDECERECDCGWSKAAGIENAYVGCPSRDKRMEINKRSGCNIPRYGETCGRNGTCPE